MFTFTLFIKQYNLIQHVRINANYTSKFSRFIFVKLNILKVLRLTRPPLGSSSISSTPSAYTWISAIRSRDLTASYRLLSFTTAELQVFFANLWSTYLAFINSLRIVLTYVFQNIAGCRTRKCQKESASALTETKLKELSITYISLNGAGFKEGQERFPSMMSLKWLFPTFLAS